MKTLLLLLSGLPLALGMTDKATGISFRNEVDGLSVFGVGVRKVPVVWAQSILWVRLLLSHAFFLSLLSN